MPHDDSIIEPHIVGGVRKRYFVESKGCKTEDSVERLSLIMAKLVDTVGYDSSLVITDEHPLFGSLILTLESALIAVTGPPQSLWEKIHSSDNIDEEAVQQTAMFQTDDLKIKMRIWICLSLMLKSLERQLMKFFPKKQSVVFIRKVKKLEENFQFQFYLSIDRIASLSFDESAQAALQDNDNNLKHTLKCLSSQKQFYEAECERWRQKACELERKMFTLITDNLEDVLKLEIAVLRERLCASEQLRKQLTKSEKHLNSCPRCSSRPGPDGAPPGHAFPPAS